MRRAAYVLLVSAVAGLIAGVGVAVPASGGPGRGEPPAAAIARYWTPERRAEAIPRDLVVDAHGLG